MPSEHLATYLRDHLAGSVVAIGLLEHLEEDRAGTELAGFFATLRGGRSRRPGRTRRPDRPRGRLDRDGPRGGRVARGEDLRVVVPADGVASNEADRDAALVLMRRVLKADTPSASDVDFAALAAG